MPVHKCANTCMHIDKYRWIITDCLLLLLCCRDSNQTCAHKRKLNAIKAPSANMGAPVPPLLLLLLRRFSWKAKLTICKIHVKMSEKYISFLHKQSFSHRKRFTALLFGSSKKFSTCERIRQRKGCVPQWLCMWVCVCVCWRYFHTLHAKL